MKEVKALMGATRFGPLLSGAGRSISWVLLLGLAIRCAPLGWNTSIYHPLYSLHPVPVKKSHNGKFANQGY